MTTNRISLYKNGLCLVFLALGLFGVFAVYPQVESLEAKKNTLYKELTVSNELLKETRSAQETSTRELKLLSEQLNTREQLIVTLKKQLTQTQNNIADLEVDVRNKKEELVVQKEEYAKMIRYAYKNNSDQGLLLFLLSAKDFNDAFRRIQYVRQYNSYRLKQVELIKTQQTEIEENLAKLEVEKEKKSGIIEEEEAVQKALIKEQRDRNQLLADLQEQEQTLNNEIDKKRIAIESLEREIKGIIRKSVEDSKKAAAAEAAKKKAEREAAEKAARAKAEKEAAKKGETLPPKKTSTKKPEPVITATPAASKLSADFSKNKGKLPWPVAKGIVTSYFGKHRHSEASSVQIENSGIDIATQEGASVKTVFKGTVTNILFSPVWQSAVLVQSGDYFVVYANLKDLQVSQGDSVDLGTVLGTASNNTAGRPEVHFEIWKETTTLNPISWLTKR